MGQKRAKDYEFELTGRHYVRTDNRDTYMFISKTGLINGREYNLLHTKQETSFQPKLTDRPLLYSILDENNKVIFSLDGKQYEIVSNERNPNRDNKFDFRILDSEGRNIRSLDCKTKSSKRSTFEAT